MGVQFTGTMNSYTKSNNQGTSVQNQSQAYQNQLAAQQQYATSGTYIVPSGAIITAASGQSWFTTTNTTGQMPMWIGTPFRVDVDKLEMKEDGLYIHSSNANTLYVISKESLESLRKIMHTLNFNEKMDKLLGEDNEET